MKTKSLLFLAALVFSTVAFAALTSTTTFYRFQCDPHFAADGTPVSAVVQAYEITTVSDGSKVIADEVRLAAQWDAVANATKTVTVNGKTYTYAEVLAATMAIAAQERTTTP